MRPKQNGRYYADDIFKCVFLNENTWISIHISLKFVPRSRIDNISSIGSDHGLEHFQRYWPFVRGIHRSSVNFPHKRPVAQSFDIFSDLHLNKRLSKQSRHWWFETPSRSLWLHCDVIPTNDVVMASRWRFEHGSSRWNIHQIGCQFQYNPAMIPMILMKPFKHYDWKIFSKHRPLDCSSHIYYSDVMMSAMASQTIGISIVYSSVCPGVDQRKHQSSASLAVVRGIHRWPVNSPHKGTVTRKMFPFDDVIIWCFGHGIHTISLLRVITNTLWAQANCWGRTLSYCKSSILKLHSVGNALLFSCGLGPCKCCRSGVNKSTYTSSLMLVLLTKKMLNFSHKTQSLPCPRILYHF